MLPKIKHPTFPIVLPISKQEVYCRPLTVQEEKIILFAKEAKTVSAIHDAIFQICTNCVEQPSDFNVDDLVLADIEVLFLHIRSISVNNTLTFFFKIPDEDQLIELTTKTDQYEIVNSDQYKQYEIVELKDQQLLIKLKIPSAKKFIEYNEKQEQAGPDKNYERLFELLVSCLGEIYFQEQLIDVSTMSTSELKGWILNLPNSVLDVFAKFFNSIPYVVFKLPHKDDVIEVAGISNFF